MPTPSISQDLYTPAVRSFIPLLYVAWADGLLSPSEVKIIRKKIKEQQYLTEGEKSVLLQWIDPQIWPDELTFRQWMKLMKDVGTEIDLDAMRLLTWV